MNPQNRNSINQSNQATGISGIQRQFDAIDRIKAAYLAQNPKHSFEPYAPKLLGGGQVIHKGNVSRENQLSKVLYVSEGDGVTVGAYGEILHIENRVAIHFDKSKEFTRQYAKVGVPLYCPRTNALIDQAVLNMNWVLKDCEWQKGEMIRLDETDVLSPFGTRPRRQWATPEQSYLPAGLNPFDYAGLTMPLYLSAQPNNTPSDHNSIHLPEVCAFLSSVLNFLNPEDRHLYLAVVGQGSRWGRFLSYPASLKSHHNYERGLLVHTAEVLAHVLLEMAHLNEPADVSLTLLAALLHDMGKTQDYIRLAEGAYISNQNCSLISHEQTMLSWIAAAGACEVSYPEDRQVALSHALCAVSRRHDQSGVRRRKTIESFLLHNADCQSARADRVKSSSILIEAGLVSSKEHIGV